MRYIEALDAYAGPERSVFLAGGIVGCPDWQQDLVLLLHNTDLVLLNPRRRHFPIDDPAAAPAQIAWEHRHLRTAAAISFWFPCESLCPIVLYERRQDVIEQTRLARPDVHVVSSLAALADRIRLVLDPLV